MTTTEVFLSHATPDREAASTLAETMRRHGSPVRYSRTNLTGAQQWHDEIGAALEGADWFVIVLSPDAVGSMWVEREIVYALSQSRFEGRIVPVLLRPCDPSRLSWVLPSIQLHRLSIVVRGGMPRAFPPLGLGYRGAT